MEFRLPSIDELNKFCSNTLIDHLGIEFTEVGIAKMRARMPVDRRTIQPMKLLHGGAMLALAETVGSAGSFVMVDSSSTSVVGMSVSANHIGNTKGQFVEAIGKLIHKGINTHIWDVKIVDETGKAISICRVTNMLIKKEGV